MRSWPSWSTTWSRPPAATEARPLNITPKLYRRVTLIALASLVLIVFTGSAVRLTASGLGCPDWPQCYGQTIPPLQINAVIEYGNRILTGFVGLAVIAASLLAFFRRPFRWHLAVIGGLLPIGVLAQAALGALIVGHHLPPELVMGHFLLSMILLDAAFALAWLARWEPGERRRSPDRLGVWAVRGLIPLGQLTVLMGTFTTGAGPHPGDHDGDLVQRIDFKGADTLAWLVERHAASAVLLLIGCASVWALLRFRAGADRRAERPVLIATGLVATQIALGITQWLAHLPAGLVWLHICLATTIWLCILWTVARAGLLEPRPTNPV